MCKPYWPLAVILLAFATSSAAVTSGTAGTITSPTPGTKLASASQLFEWTAGTGITRYVLEVGSKAGGHDIAYISAGTALSYTVPELPMNGETLYVTLGSLNGSTWLTESYVYYAAGTGTAASITSPGTGVKLSSTTQLFQWSGGVGITRYVLNIGTKSGGHDIAVISAGSATSYNVTGLPNNGETLYVSLGSLNGNTWLSKNYTYIASGVGTAASITSPGSGSKLASNVQLFQWSGGVGITRYVLNIGTKSGGHDLAAISAGSATSYNVTNLPNNGETLYVSLGSLNGNTWLGKSYTYIASGTGTAASITSPGSGSKLTGTTQLFQWSGGVGISRYVLDVGTSPGAHDIALVNAGTASSVSVPGLPTAGQTIYVTLGSLNGNTWLSKAYTYTAMGTAMAFGCTQNDIDNGLVNYEYAACLNVTGGSPPYAFSVASGTVPPGVAVQGGGGGNLLGTPTKAGTYTFAIKAVDSKKNALLSPSYQIVISALSSAHNSWLKGRYVCELEFYHDADDSRSAMLMSASANGAGTLSMVYDSNGRSSGPANGSGTGTYSLDATNNGVLTLTSTTGTLKFAILANNLSGPQSSSIQLVAIDDVTGASGHHGGGRCYLATMSAFTTSTLAGHGYVFLNHGEGNDATTKVVGGRFNMGTFSGSSGPITAGVADAPQVGTSVWNAAFTGTYTAPDSTTGRYTSALTDSSNWTTHSVVYIIDANHQFILRIDSIAGEEVGEIYTQKQASYSNANLNGAFVLHHLMWELDSTSTLQRYFAEMTQGSGDGAGSMALNVSYHQERDIHGDGGFGTSTAETVTGLSVASNGRLSVSEGNGVTGVLYFYDTNSALWLAGGLNSGSNLYNLDFGYMEPQTLKTFTDSAIAGTYFGSNLPRIEPDGGSSITQIAVNSSGGLSGIEDDGGPGWMGYANTMDLTYTWESTSFGVIAVSQSGQQVLTCIAVTAKKFVCMENGNHYPAVSYGQQ